MYEENLKPNTKIYLDFFLFEYKPNVTNWFIVHSDHPKWKSQKVPLGTNEITLMLIIIISKKLLSQNGVVGQSGKGFVVKCWPF